MSRRAIALLLLAITLGLPVCLGVASVPRRPPPRPVDVEPDTSKAIPLDRWPNDADLARLKSAEGKSKAEVIRLLGHPRKVERRPDGTEVWDYPWVAGCRVWIKDGVCTGTYYTGGY
jgi:hypothetical protein